MPKPPPKPGPARTVIATVNVGNDHADLVEEHGRDVLRGPHGVVEVGAAEKSMLRDCGDIVTDHVRDSAAAVDAGGLSHLQTPTGESPLAVMLDTTTYFNAIEALHGTPTPLGVLDLALLTVAAVAFDTVVIQPEPFAGSGQEEFWEFTHVLPRDPQADGRLLRLYQQTLRLCEKRKDQYERSWSTFLDTPVTIDLTSVQARADERYWPSDTVTEPPEEAGALNNFVGVQTVRAWLNDSIASGLRVPHMASSVRLPVAADLTQAHHEFLWLLRGLIAAAGPPAAKPQATPLAPRLPLSAPFLLALVLRKMKSPDDYKPAVLELRDRFGLLRHWIRKHPERAGWQGKPQKLTAAYAEALPAEYAKQFGEIAARVATERQVKQAAWADLGGAVLDGAAALASLPGVAGPSIKLLMTTQSPGPLRQQWLRLRHPEVYLLFDLAGDITEISTLDDDIRRIWDEPAYVTDRQVLGRLGGYSGDPFLSVGRLT